jgi:hypothetical protein
VEGTALINNERVNIFHFLSDVGVRLRAWALAASEQVKIRLDTVVTALHLNVVSGAWA